MKIKKAFYLFTVAIIITILLAACSQAPTTVPANTQAPNPVFTQVESGQTPVPTRAAPTVPSDVPIMSGSYDMEVPNSLNVTYKVDAPIKDVVAFYQTALQENGWTVTNNPDSVVGAMAQISRSRTNGDRITFSLQYNSVGSFTVVQIFLNREPTPIATP
jgi:hypothetical protein